MLSLLYLLAETDILLRLSEQNSFRQLGVSGLARCLCACVSVCMCQKRKRTRASEKKEKKSGTLEDRVRPNLSFI